MRGRGLVAVLVLPAALMVAAPAAASPSVSLEEVVVLPEGLDAQPAAGNAAWLDQVDPQLGEWVTGAAAVRPPSLPERGGGVVFAHGVRFDTVDHARTAWSAIRAADAGDGRRYDVEGFGDVHALREPLGIGGVALVDYHRLVGTDIYVLKVRVDGPEEVSDDAGDVLSWHAERLSDDGTLRPGGSRTAVVVVAVLAAGAIGVLLVRRRA